MGYGWPRATVDIDLALDPEPAGAFEAIAALEDELDVDVELASPDQFVPPVPDWRERSAWIARHGSVDFYVDDACSRYDSLRRELDSFLAALEGRRRRAPQARDGATG